MLAVTPLSILLKPQYIFHYDHLRTPEQLRDKHKQRLTATALRTFPATVVMETFKPSKERSLRRKEAVRWETERFNRAIGLKESLGEMEEAGERRAGAESTANTKDQKEKPAKDAPGSSQKVDRK